jgi:hypothetical protein
MKLLVALLACLAVATGAAATSPPQTAAEIEDCVRENLPEKSSIQTIVLRATDRVGGVSESKTKLYWKKGDDGFSRVLLRFSAPPDMRGSALLLIEKDDRNDMFMYLPELKRVRRVTGHMMGGSMFGTDFTYEQFERLQGLAEDVSSERLPDVQLDGKTAYVVSHLPDQEEGSDFEKVVAYVDSTTCVPLKVEFFEKGERLRKLLTTDPSQITKEGESWIPRRLLMQDLLDQTETELIVEKIEVGASIHRKMFTQRALERGN